MRCTTGVVGRNPMEMQIRQGVTNPHRSGTVLERLATEGESPVCETVRTPVILFPSTAGHVKSCGNSGGPPSKAKYSSVTDSELVP